MKHLLKIDEIAHLNKKGEIIWKQNDVNNIFHVEGHYFLVNLAFNTSSGITVPANYYLGLDNRTTVQASDTFEELSEEPTQNGYARQAVNSLSGFTISFDGTIYRAISGTVTFEATGGSWGPVINLFLGTTSDDTGYLISTVVLETSRTVAEDESITMRISIALRN